MKYSKKAMMPGQIFIYILAIIIFSMTLLYGYRAIKHFQSRTGEIELLQLEKDIKNEIKNIRSDYGSVNKKILNVPSGYEEVCFVTSYPGFPADTLPPTAEDYPLIKDHIEGGFEDKNMFLWPDGDVSFYIGDINVKDTDFICIEITGTKITLRLESKGDYVEVSKWE